jgi:hypothetical protein
MAASIPKSTIPANAPTKISSTPSAYNNNDTKNHKPNPRSAPRRCAGKARSATFPMQARPGDDLISDDTSDPDLSCRFETLHACHDDILLSRTGLYVGSRNYGLTSFATACTAHGTEGNLPTELCKAGLEGARRS